MRESRIFFLFVFLCLMLATGLFTHSKTELLRFRSIQPDITELTSKLKLTDLSFSTDARYTRHPSQADLFSAFQDYPGSIEHFPSGSVTPPPDFSSLGTRILVGKR